MKVTILGAGIIGVTTAYLLAERGHEVTVIERQHGPGMETSFANGGQLSYCHSEPWANPAVIPKIIKWLGKKDAPLVLTPRLDPEMWWWGIRFLFNCTQGRAEFNTVNTLRLALYSRDVMRYFREKTRIDFNFKDLGILHVFKDEKTFEANIKQARFQEQFGAKYKSLSYHDVVKLEPALANSEYRIIGGIHFPMDESGDIYEFTKQLAAKCQAEYGVTFKYNHTVTGLIREGGKIAKAITDNGEFAADSFVMALGSYAPVFLRKLGIYTSIYPMKGYSISIPVRNNVATPTLSITDQDKKLVYSRLGDILRVAGTAEFAKYDTSVSQFRTEGIRKSAMKMFPDAGDFDKITKWACLRPSTPSGAPVLGKTKISNLFLNTGHGTLGWTLGAGSAKIIADMVEGKQPEIDLAGLSLAS